MTIAIILIIIAAILFYFMWSAKKHKNSPEEIRNGIYYLVAILAMLALFLLLSECGFEFHGGKSIGR
jgi:hypothetical protein